MVEPENISGTGKMLGRRLSENELDWILILSNVIFVVAFVQIRQIRLTFSYRQSCVSYSLVGANYVSFGTLIPMS
jgi:hypothetical protein